MHPHKRLAAFVSLLPYCLVVGVGLRLLRRITSAPLNLPDRVLELRRIRGADLLDHPLNFRTHDAAQATIMDALLTRFGLAGNLLVYESARYGGTVILNGHQRKHRHPEQRWPCLVLDLDDDDAAAYLLYIDAVSTLAGEDPALFAALHERVREEDATLAQFTADRLAAFSFADDGDPPPFLGGEAVGDAGDPAAADVPLSQVRMWQLFLTEASYPPFKARVDALREHFGADSATDAIVEAISYACRALDLQPA